ncbi:MAG TPA: nucleoside phosphorylase [Geobacteraceae bacterium]
MSPTGSTAQSTTIGIVTSLAEETKPLLRRFPRAQRAACGSFPAYRFDAGSNGVMLVQAGMGEVNASDASRCLVETARPGLLLSAGFTGAIRPGPLVGDLVVATALYRYQQNFAFAAVGLSDALTTRLLALTSTASLDRPWHCLPGTFLTTGHSVAKTTLNRQLPSVMPNPVIEMETAAVAAVAAEWGIPCGALRAVSDAASDELDFTVEELCDEQLRLRPSRIIKTILRRPRLIGQFLRLARNSATAGENLATALAQIVEQIDVNL